MNSYLIAAVGLVYLWVSVTQLVRRDYGMAIVFGGYAFSNIGLMMGVK